MRIASTLLALALTAAPLLVLLAGVSVWYAAAMLFVLGVGVGCLLAATSGYPQALNQGRRLAFLSAIAILISQLVTGRIDGSEIAWFVLPASVVLVCYGGVAVGVIAVTLVSEGLRALRVTTVRYEQQNER